MEIDFEKLVGKRILAKAYPHAEIGEYKVLEVSPASKFVKLESAITGNQCWKNINQIVVIEILKTIKLK